MSKPRRNQGGLDDHGPGVPRMDHGLADCARMSSLRWIGIEVVVTPVDPVGNPSLPLVRTRIRGVGNPWTQRGASVDDGGRRRPGPRLFIRRPPGWGRDSTPEVRLSSGCPHVVHCPWMTWCARVVRVVVGGAPESCKVRAGLSGATRTTAPAGCLANTSRQPERPAPFTMRRRRTAVCPQSCPHLCTVQERPSRGRTDRRQVQAVIRRGSSAGSGW